MKFDYNPISICNIDNELDTNDTHCIPWTRNIESCWNYTVFHKYAGYEISTAENRNDLRIKMIPEYCD